MKFKEWIVKETGTSTGDIGGFSRICIPMVRRFWPPEWGSWKDERKKKVKKQPQVEEHNGSHTT